MFYAQSTGTVISGWERELERERVINKELCMSSVWQDDNTGECDCTADCIVMLMLVCRYTCVTFSLVWRTCLCLWYRLKNLTALQMVLSCSCLCDVHTCVTFMLVWHSYLCDAHACVTFILVWRSRQCDVHACVTFILVWCSCLCDVHACVTFSLVWLSCLCDIRACAMFMLVV